MTPQENALYQVELKNVPFRQAQGIYRFLVDLHDNNEFYGDKGENWSGLIEGQRHSEQMRSIIIRPMAQIREARQLRDNRIPEGLHVARIIDKQSGVTRHIICIIRSAMDGGMREYVDVTTGDIVGCVGVNRFDEYVTPLAEWIDKYAR